MQYSPTITSFITHGYTERAAMHHVVWLHVPPYPTGYACPWVAINTIRRKILMGENIDEYDKFPVICQNFPYQNFHLVSYLSLMNLWQSGFT